MKSLILVVAGLAAVSACSDARNRRVTATDNSAQRPDLTLPDTTMRRDTSLALSSRGSQPVSPVEQQAPRTAQARPAPQRRKHVARATTPPAVTSTRADTSTRAYAPNVNPDTAPTPAPERVAADSSSAARPDTATAPATDSATVRAPDTIATRTPDTASAARDTALASNSVETPAPPAGVTDAAARTLATGTEIHAALDDSINSRSDTVGEIVSAHVMENVTGPDGRTLIAAGTPVRFTIMRLGPAKSQGSQGRLALRADGIAFNGQLQPIKANVRPVPRELRGRGVTGSEAAKVGVGAAGGAVLGRVIGGNTRGAVIGGVVGAAGGAVVASKTATRDVVVKAKTPMVIVLTEPLVAP